jgi:hypothetical protein
MNDGILEVEVEEKKRTETLSIPLAEVKEARVDFKF